MTYENIFDEYNVIVSEFFNHGFKINPQPMRGSQSDVDCNIAFSDGKDTYMVSIVTKHAYGIKVEKNYTKILVEKFNGFGIEFHHTLGTLWIDSDSSGAEKVFEKVFYRFNDSNFYSEDKDDIFDCHEKHESRYGNGKYEARTKRYNVKPENAVLVLKKVPGYKRIKADAIENAYIINRSESANDKRVLKIWFNNGKDMLTIPMTSISEVKYGW